MSKKDREPSVILVGGSSVVFGFNSPLISDSLHKPIINDGLHAGVGMKLLVDNCKRFLKPGDTLVVIPEYSHFFGDQAWGHVILADLFYLAPTDFSTMLVPQQWFALAENTPGHIRSKMSFFISKITHSAVDKEYSVSSFNQYGDKTEHYGKPNKGFNHNYSPKDEIDDVNTTYIKILFQQIKEIQQEGVKVLLYPPSMAESYYESEKINVRYVNETLQKNGFSFLCSPEDCVYSDSLFYDSYYHLNEEGATINSLNLINCIRKI